MAQENRNSGFRLPMDLPLNLAGSFAEPRPNHFHSGIDIKTNGIEGQPVFAIADGYISRIKVSPYGYGKAIYITHTNGFTSVYAHLSKFYGAIDKYITTQHYAKQQAELDIYLEVKKIPLAKGDTIAFSGNTGGSSAPHLHFEIRDTKTEHALNPLDFYPKNFYADTIAPQINSIKINVLSNNNSMYAYQSYYYTLQQQQNNAWCVKDTIKMFYTSDISIALSGFDKQDVSTSKNGIQRMEVFQNNKLQFSYNITEIDFDKTKMCNAFVDYNDMMNDNGYYYNCYQLPQNTLPYYNVGNGKLFLQNGMNEFVVNCYDYNKNKTIVQFSIIADSIEYMSIDTVSEVNDKLEFATVYTNKKDSIILNNLKILFSKNTFYDNDIFMQVKLDNENNIEKYHLSYDGKYVAFNNAAKISITSKNKKNSTKTIIVREDEKGKLTALKTNYYKNKFYADTKDIGTFYLKQDTIKPEIQILNLKSEVINIRVTDSLSGIDTYKTYIDNQWANFYYDAKNDELQYQFDKKIANGEHLLKIIVTDKVANKSILTKKFNY